MHYIVSGAKKLKITHTAGMLGKLLKRVDVNEYDAIDFLPRKDSSSGSRPVNYPEYFKEATNVDKLLIMGKKIPCIKIHGSIEYIRAYHD